MLLDPNAASIPAAMSCVHELIDQVPGHLEKETDRQAFFSTWLLRVLSAADIFVDIGIIKIHTNIPVLGASLWGPSTYCFADNLLISEIHIA